MFSIFASILPIAFAKSMAYRYTFKHVQPVYHSYIISVLFIFIFCIIYIKISAFRIYRRDITSNREGKSLFLHRQAMNCLHLQNINFPFLLSMVKGGHWLTSSIAAVLPFTIFSVMLLFVFFTFSIIVSLTLFTVFSIFITLS